MELSYKVHTKHRKAKPTADASVWSVSEWVEITLFARAGSEKWTSMSKAKKYLWALQSNFSVLGQGLEKNGRQVELHFAKFVEDNSVWHGYPVQARGDDIPPESVLNCWLESKIINKAEKLKIIGGQFK
ncbi:hypothetical protein DFR41_1019 [Pseudacidovorax intermedius]|uniref:Uncharacterized protein n=1 Tax=Pseudacidovorax intermedius TaxID=433924 RepID=A0A370FKP2_9BURK|nr:hypothetical protein [Pseudacidovorax intermedius]RDI28257.1 hypothetical protein DFR41_1019 [Pseudacidovorax intermedius]